MNAYYSGLGIARSLHGAGVQVYALTSERDVPGIRSRYFHGIYEVPNGRDEPERLRDRLLELRTGFAERPVFFPTRDFDVLFLHEYRDALAAAYVLPQPADSPIVRIMDKLELATVAEEQGIPTPTTMVCRSAAELEEAIPRLRFPVVMKPRFAYQWRRKGTWEKVGAKAIITQSADELRLQCRRLAELTPDIMLQEYVAGDDRDIVVCCGYVGREGKLLGYFTGRKLKQSPPFVGTGSIVEAVDIPILAPTLKLLKAFGYAGLAEVEFKYDADSGRYFLIEVNPRHWDQHELGTLVGVNLSRIAYSDMIGVDTAPIRPYYEPGRQYKWVAERELVYAIVQRVKREVNSTGATNGKVRASLRTLANALRETYGLLRGKRILGILKLRDPRPALALCLGILSEAFRFVAAGADSGGDAPARVQEVGKDRHL
jgi:predicted ATP-grasp superfamily ATP-dependent carboligase